jgi:hypothetical protein
VGAKSGRADEVTPSSKLESHIESMAKEAVLASRFPSNSSALEKTVEKTGTGRCEEIDLTEI